MKITPTDVRHVASLASLEVAEAETEILAEQLSRIVTYVEKLNELDTEQVEPTAQVAPGRPHSPREDRVESRTGSGEAGRTVKFFNVPRVITGK